MSEKIRDMRNGTKLLKLFSDHIISYEQLEKAAKIVGRERNKYQTIEWQDKAVEAKSLELVTAIKACKSRNEIDDVLNSFE